MSQLATAPLRTARQLKKFKEIKKVKAAIRWHERARKRRQLVSEERYESKRTAMNVQQWENDNVLRAKKQALRDAREDWLLGPLRPNRAVGTEAARYGVFKSDQMRRPDIPVRVQKTRNEVKERKGLQVEYPLVVDDKKYFPITEDDRVVIMKGREKDKIGTVAYILESSHEVVIKGLNMHYGDSRSFQSFEDRNGNPKRETEIPFALSDVRLVVPYRITSVASDGSPKDIFQDVIVDNVVMERHTTGVDPFTGIDYGNDEFPEEHRYDPESGLPIFNRYIAGTRRRIQWPWEKEEETNSREEFKPVEEKKDFKTRVKTMFSNPIQTIGGLARWRNSKKAEKRENQQDVKEVQKINDHLQSEEIIQKPRSMPDKKPPAFDDDTGRNLVDPTDEGKTFYPTLVYPPFPNELSTELASESREKRRTDAKDEIGKSVTQTSAERERVQRELDELEAKQRQLESMKTPLQLRWEVERAKKLQEEAVKPRVSTDALMLALGQHMQSQGIKLTQKRQKMARKTEDVD